MSEGRIEVTGIAKAFGRRLRSCRQPRVRSRPRARPDGQERIRKIHAGQGAGRRPLQPDAGARSAERRAAAFVRPADAFAAGIVTIHQELSLVPSLSVGGEYLPRSSARIAAASVSRRSTGPKCTPRPRDCSSDMGLDLDPATRVERHLGRQQVVEIVKAMASIRPSCCWTSQPRRSHNAKSGCCSPHAPAQRAGRDDGLHHPPHERAVRDRRHLHGAAGRSADRSSWRWTTRRRTISST